METIKIIIILIVIIGVSIGAGYLMQKSRGYINPPKVMPETLVLDCKKTGRNYDCDPRQTKKK